MSMIPSSNPRKRQSRDWEALQTPRSSQNACKRQRSTTSDDSPSQSRSRSRSPSAFWNNLSVIHLTRGALEELDRRNSTGRTLTCPDACSQAVTPVADYLGYCTVRTLNNLQRFARRGGPDMSDAQGYRIPGDRPQRAASSRRSASRTSRQNPTPTPSEQASTETANTKSSGPYNRNFQQNLVDHGVFPANYKYPDGRIPPLPRNWSEINERLVVPRRSLSPSRVSGEDFQKFQTADGDAFKEKQVSESVISIIDGQDRNGQCKSGGVAFRNLEPLTDGTIKPGNPDIYEGARPEQIDRRVRDELRGMIIPTTQEELPVCPNFFVAAKGPDGSLAVAMRQACYDGALGARGMHSLQTYGSIQSVPDNSAHTVTAIYHGGTLKIYTVSRAEAVHPRGHPEYYMHQLNTWGMTGNLETFRQGVTAFRNARDWAEQQRNEAIAHANNIVHTDAGLDIEDTSLSPESVRYTTPPTERTLDTSLAHESSVAGLETTKRNRTDTQGSSPTQQQKKRSRVNN